MDQSLITCTNCSVCDFLKFVENLFYFLLALSFVVALFFVILSGIVRIASIGDKFLNSMSKRGLKFALIGFIVCLVAWLLIHTTYSVLGVKGDNWWNLECQENQPELNQNGYNIQENYSQYTDIKPVSSLNEIITGDKKIGILDLENVDEVNLEQDIALLYPGEQIKFLAGYGNISSEDLNNLINIINGSLGENSQSQSLFDDLQKKIKEIADLNMYDGGPAVVGTNDYSQITSGDPLDSNFNPTLDKLIKLLLQQTIKRVIVYKYGNSEVDLDKCIESNGDWVAFYNECTSRKQICGKENVRCSTISNEFAGCQCPEGNCLINGKCTVRSNANNTKKDDDGDGVKNNLDKCAGTPKGESINKDSQSENYGCSCSQLNLLNRTCPSTRCEGVNLVTYPALGKDTCTSGKITRYSCSPSSSVYNSTCSQVQNVTNPIDKTNQIQENSDLYKKLKDWLDKQKNQQNTGSGGSGTGGGSGSGGNSGGGGGGIGNGGSNTGNSDSTSTGGDRTSNGKDTSSSSNDTTQRDNYTPSGDLGKDGNFDQLAQCMGFKKGEIPKNGAMIGFYKDKSHTTMDVWYLDPRTGKAEGNNGDSGMPLRTYPQGTGGGIGKNGIYAVQVQPHYSDNADTVESPLTMRSDLRMSYDGSSTSRTTRINIHPGQHTAGCLGTGSRSVQDNFMRDTWTTVRGSEKPADYNDDCSQAKGNCYNKHRKDDTILFSTMDYGQCQGDPYKAIQTLQSRNDYSGYDPKIIDFSKNVKS